MTPRWKWGTITSHGDFRFEFLGLTFLGQTFWDGRTHGQKKSYIEVGSPLKNDILWLLLANSIGNRIGNPFKGKWADFTYILLWELSSHSHSFVWDLHYRFGISSFCLLTGRCRSFAVRIYSGNSNLLTKSINKLQ